MGTGAQSVFGLLCVAALIALPTLQAANSSPDAPVVAIAHAEAVPAPETDVLPDPQIQDQVDHDMARGGVVREQLPRVAFTTAGGVTPTQLPMPTPNTVADNGEWVWPTPSKLITSPFGYRSDPFNGGSAFHSGLDLGDRCGTAIGSTRAGWVTFAGAAGGYGLRVVVDHGAGVWSAYSHLQAIAVQVGQQVDQSGLLGLVGTTGRSTGCHLHFEIIINGGFTDPLPYLIGQPVADPSTYGNANIPSAPISDPSTSPSSPSPSASEDPCGVSDDPQDALDTGGMIPVDDLSPSPTPSATKTPCPTSSSPSPSSPTATPSDSASSSSTPSTPEGTSPASPASESSTQTPDDSSSSSSQTPGSPEPSTPGSSDSSSGTPTGADSSSSTPSDSSTSPNSPSSESGTPTDPTGTDSSSSQPPSDPTSTQVLDTSTGQSLLESATGSSLTTDVAAASTSVVDPGASSHDSPTPDQSSVTQPVTPEPTADP